jgi:hypothetical protein
MVKFRRWSWLSALLGAFLVLVLASPAQADKNHSVAGSGSTNNFLCPNRTTIPANISFSAAKTSGGLTGDGQIGPGPPGAFIFFTLSSGTINTSSYSMSGTVGLPSSSFVSCDGFFGMVTGSMTLSGNCGTGVTINYSDTLGDKGTFIGNVSCP